MINKNKNKVYSLSEFKRDVAKGGMYLELIERYDVPQKDLPKKISGLRKITRYNTVGLTLENSRGEESTLSFGSAKLMEYTKDTLVVYEAGEREPTNEEKELLNKWQQKEKEITKNNPFAETYWQKLRFFKNSKYPYMSGFDSLKGSKSYQLHNGKVRDKSIKGKVILRYNVYFTEDMLDKLNILNKVVGTPMLDKVKKSFTLPRGYHLHFGLHSCKFCIVDEYGARIF